MPHTTMKILFICDSGGDGALDIAMRTQALGHQVRFFASKFDRRTRPVGVGLIELVNDWRPYMPWADLVLLEGNGKYMREMDAWRQRGCLIVGGNEQSAAWELNREEGMNVFRKAGVAVPEYRVFNDYDQAIRYVERRGEPLFSKPCSDTSDKSLSAKTGIPEDPTWMLRHWKAKHGRPPCPFLVQDPVAGVELGVGVWVGPAGFAEGFEENHEFKRMFANDVGINTGEMGSVMRYVRRSKIAEQVLLPCEEAIQRLGVCTNFDVNCIVDNDGTCWPLEWTVRFGWPSTNIEWDLFNCDPMEFLAATASGESIRGAHRLNQVALGVILALSPYPHSPRDYQDILDIPIYGTDHSFHPCEVQADKDADYASAGHYLGVSVGTGERVSTAAKNAYRALNKISMPASPFHRSDIGARLKRELPRLAEHGFATAMEF